MHQPRLAHRDEHGIGRARMHRDLTRHVVAHGDRGAEPHHQEGDRLAHDLGVADHADIEPFGLERQGFQNLHRRDGGTGTQLQLVIDDVADRCGVHPLHVLERMNGLLQNLDRDMRGQRALDDDAIDARIGVQTGQHALKLFEADRLGVVAHLEGHAGFLGVFLLVAHIEFGGGDIADRDRDEARRPACLRKPLRLGEGFVQLDLRKRLSVNDRGAHRDLPCPEPVLPAR